MSFPIPENEEARLAALRACEILDTSPEREFDSLTRLAAKICGTPIAQALGAALDLRDNETAGHSRRVTRYCLEMARRMGYKRADLKSLERGSYLHDIGKIGIPDSVLLKPGALDANERRVMESHVRIGYKLVNHISFLSDSAELVLCHQERFDGTGYPRGLKGSEIPLGARIFSVADTLDAMTSDRPYRFALPFAEARAEIVHGSGTQFDPNVVAAFLATPENAWEDIRREVSSRYGSRHSSAAAGG